MEGSLPTLRQTETRRRPRLMIVRIVSSRPHDTYRLTLCCSCRGPWLKCGFWAHEGRKAESLATLTATIGRGPDTERLPPRSSRGRSHQPQGGFGGLHPHISTNFTRTRPACQWLRTALLGASVDISYARLDEARLSKCGQKGARRVAHVPRRGTLSVTAQGQRAPRAPPWVTRRHPAPVFPEGER